MHRWFPLACNPASRLPPCYGRTMNNADGTAMNWLRIVRSEYLEMPGLQLTRSQASRLWGLDTHSCAAILNTLVKEDFLRVTSDGSYARTGRVIFIDQSAAVGSSRKSQPESLAS
jgi:hypothetical protein